MIIVGRPENSSQRASVSTPLITMKRWMFFGRDYVNLGNITAGCRLRPEMLHLRVLSSVRMQLGIDHLQSVDITLSIENYFRYLALRCLPNSQFQRTSGIKRSLPVGRDYLQDI